MTHNFYGREKIQLAAIPFLTNARYRIENLPHESASEHNSDDFILIVINLLAVVVVVCLSFPVSAVFNMARRVSLGHSSSSSSSSFVDLLMRLRAEKKTKKKKKKKKKKKRF